MNFRRCATRWRLLPAAILMAFGIIFDCPLSSAQTAPVISSFSPSGKAQFQPAAKLTFNAAAAAGIAAGGISVQLTATSLSGLVLANTYASTNGLTLTGSATSWTASVPLTSNVVYTAIINVLASNGLSSSSNLTFDTISPAYLFEAEDFDYGSGLFFDNPQTNAYRNLAAVANVDVSASGGANAYRSNNPGLATENAGDTPRAPYVGTGKTDYDVGYNDGGKWGNYTRTFPAGTFNIFMRAANPNGYSANAASLYWVTAGRGSTNQILAKLGSFSVPGTGDWQKYTWVPLLDGAGNLARFAGGSVKTLRETTDGGSYNANCYLLMPADLSVPVITNVYPNGTNFFQLTNRLAFTVSCTAGVATSNILMTVDGVNVSSAATFSGLTTSWNVCYAGLALNTNHNVVITVLANNGQGATNTVSFNNFSPSNYQWEAEDYDYNGGQYFDAPQTNAYAGRASIPGVDNRQSDLGGSPFLYRPNSPAPSTTVAGDGLRPQFAGQTDYNIGFFGAGSWLNFTRHYPAGTYQVWARFAEGSTATLAVLSQLTGGQGTSLQSSNQLGTFSLPNSGGWAAWAWAPLRDASGNLVKVRFDGAPTTLQLGGSPVAGQPEVNVNFLMLTPATPDVLGIVEAINNGPDNVQITWSKPVEAGSATLLANYVFTNGQTVTGASLSPDALTVVLTTSPLVYGSNYTLVINGVRDRMNLPNTIATNTVAHFQALPFTLNDLGNPTVLSGAQVAGNGLNVTAAGTNFGGSADQGSFSCQTRSGDFDVSVRVAGLDLSDLFAKAGLMARETLAVGSRFAASLATPAMNGCFFAWRNPAGSASSSAGSFPVNYPNTWLRLQRVGNVFTSFAGYDGQQWTQLGSTTITMSNQVFLGFAVSSRSASQTTVAQFRDFGNVSGALVGAPANPHELIGPSSRRTPLVFSEIMYKPAPRADSNNVEFIELYNSNPWFHDLSGYRLATADLSYTFPAGTVLPGGAFLVVAASPAGLANVYGLTTNVYGPYTGSLKKSGTLQLFDEQGAVLLSVPYANAPPWPVAATGSGHSIVLANPTYGEGDPRAWDLSDIAGGSPGAMEAFRPSPLRNVVINEFLAHTDLPEHDYVELYNHSPNAVDVSGCILTDDPVTNRFVIPPGTLIPARGFVSFLDTALGFRLNAAGESIYLKNPDQTRVLDAVQFGAQQNGVATGRWPDGANDFYRLTAPTPGGTNAPIRLSDVVINELMYDPITGNDDDQYVELYNRGTNTVDMGGWQLADGLAYTFPTNTPLAAGGYLVVGRNRVNLLNKYPQLNTGNSLGDFSGKLSHNGERVALTMPAEHHTLDASGNPVTNIIHIPVNEVTYGTGGSWGQWSAGGGSSLELIDPNSNGRLAPNWADSDETQKSAWTSIETTGVLDLGQNYEAAIAHAQLGLLDAGECLVDNVEVVCNNTNFVANGTFESGTNGWAFQGCMSRSSLESSGYGGSGHSLHIRASDALWTGDNSCQVTLTNTTLSAGQTATLRFKARWLHGWPEALLRLNGNWLEAAGALPVPAGLGTPGLPNSRLVANAGPAIYQVTHTPALPAANQPVVVTAKVHDAAGVSALTLYYRVDPAAGYTALPMRDSGFLGDAVAGDGVYSTTITGRAANTLVAFYISATDSLGATNRFPTVLNDGAPPREALVRFGDDNPGGSFGVYHLWVSQTNRTRWEQLGNLSNEGNDGTFVCGSRVIYNVQGRFTGSPYHQNYNQPDGNACNYKWMFNDDDKFLGATSFNKIHAPGNYADDDSTLQREQLANTLLRRLGVPWLNRRYVVVYVNGNRRGPLMEDAQTPDGDLVKEYFPADPDGWLYKMQPWFEFAPELSGGYLDFANQSWATLNDYTTTGGARKTARYRYNYLVRRTPGSASDFSPVYALVTAANSAGLPGFSTNLQNVADLENWMRVFAANHAAGNWDCFGVQNGQNLYGYCGAKGTKYSLLMFDFNIGFGNQGTSWGPGENLIQNVNGDTALNAIYTTPVFRRMYWRALAELVNGPLDTGNSGPLLDAKYQTFVASGLSVEDPATNLKPWLTQARSSIAAQLAAVDATTYSVTTATVNQGVAQISGTAPVTAQTVWINGVACPLTWSTLTGWSTTFVLGNGTNQLNIVGVDSHGVPLAGATNRLTVTNDVTVIPPVPPSVVINEWLADNTHSLADPADNDFEDWFELYNPATNAVDLGGFFLTDKLTAKFQYQIPGNGHYVVPPRGFLLVWADGETNQNSTNLLDLHVNFALSKGGEAIGLFKADGTAIDTITFGAQTSDVSQGRLPDGGTNIVFMAVTTPRTNNVFNTPPVLASISNVVLTLGQTLAFAAHAVDADLPAQTLLFSLVPGAPAGAGISASGQFAWTPAAAPQTNWISIQVVDTGVPPATAVQSFMVVVNAPPQVTGAAIGNGQLVLSCSTGRGQNYQLEFKDSLAAPAWVPLGGPFPGTGGWLFVTNDLTLSTQRFFRIRVQ